MLRIGEQLVREDGREMLERHRRSKAHDRRAMLGQSEPVGDPRFQLGQVVARIFRALVERIMLAAVDRFLRRERLDFLRELGRSALPEIAYAFDEIGFAPWE